MADAYVQLTDSIIPSVYAQYAFEAHVQSLEIYQAGVLSSDPAVPQGYGSGRFSQAPCQGLRA